MRVGKQTLCAIILAVIVSSASPAWASNGFLDTMHNIFPSLDFLRPRPQIGETLWRPLPTTSTAFSPACTEQLLTRAGRRECASDKATRLTKDEPHVAPVIANANPANSWTMTVLGSSTDLDFSDDTKVAYSDAPPPEAADDDGMRVVPLWRDELYDHNRSPTAGVTFRSNF